MSISIEDIARNTELRKALATLDFVVLERHETGDDWYHVEASERFVAVGGDGAGGRFMLGQASGQVLYLSTEGRAGVIAASLAEFLGLVALHPYWQDLLKFSGNGQVCEMQRSVAVLRGDASDLVLNAERVIQLLRDVIDLPTLNAAVERLHEAVSDPSTMVAVFSPEGDAYEGLFNRFSADNLIGFTESRGA